MENSRSDSAGSNRGERCIVASSWRSASLTAGSSCSPKTVRLYPRPSRSSSSSPK